MDSIEINKKYKLDKKLEKEIVKTEKDMKKLRLSFAARKIRQSSNIKMTHYTNLSEKQTKNDALSSKQTSKKNLDSWFSRYIRLKDADCYGMVQCVTCDVILFWKNIQCGHFIKRGNMQYRWDEKNCHPQCEVCNCYLDGNMIEYEKYMRSTYGDKIVDEMMNPKALYIVPLRVIEEKIRYYQGNAEYLLSFIKG